MVIKMKNGKRNKRGLTVRSAAIAMALVFGVTCWFQGGVVSHASNTLGSQGSTASEGGDAAAVVAIIGENQEEGTGSSAAKVKVIEASVRVRKEASTNSDVAGKLSNGDVVDVVGETNGADGYLWYQITGSISGYVRSDLVEVTETVQAPAEETPAEVPAEEIPAEDPEPVVTVPNDYEVAYADDGTGANDWYLNDNINGTRYKVSELLNAEQTNASLVDSMEEETGSLRTIIIVLAVIIGLLVVVVTVLIFKLRSAYGDGYEYDDEDEDDEEEEEEEDEPRKRSFFSRRPSRYDEDEDDEEEDDEDDDEDDRPSRRFGRGGRQEAPKAGRGKARNFAQDDDEDMEFEFLDLK